MSSDNVIVKCEECGKQFMARNRSARFCGSSCRQVSYKIRHTCYACGERDKDIDTALQLPEIGETTLCQECKTIGESILAVNLVVVINNKEVDAFFRRLYSDFQWKHRLDKPFCEWAVLPKDYKEMTNYNKYLLDKKQDYDMLMRRLAHIRLRHLQYE